jgi:NitT/TauT family transport system permease protein
VTRIVLISSPLFVLALWEMLSRTEVLVPAYILPPPSHVVVSIFTVITADWFPPQLGVTLFETIAGFCVGSLAGLAIGVLMGYASGVRRLAQPYVVALQITPKVILAPLFITWFGFGMTSKVMMAATIAFFPVVINTVVGLMNVDESSIMLMRSLVASPSQTFFKLAWPSALPFVFAGLRTSLTLALTGALVAEFIGAKIGLGSLIKTFSFESDAGLVFAVLTLISLVGLALYGVLAYVDRRIVFWRQH